MKRQFTVRQLLVVIVVIGAILAWFSWRELWESRKAISALDAREKIRDDGTAVWQLYMKTKTVYADDRGLEVPPPAISKREVASALLIVFWGSGIALACYEFPTASLAREVAVAGCALPIIIFLIEAVFFICKLPDLLPRVH